LKPVFFDRPFELESESEIGFDDGGPPPLGSREDIATVPSVLKETKDAWKEIAVDDEAGISRA
jgi:hypothetical protein